MQSVPRVGGHGILIALRTLVLSMSDIIHFSAISSLSGAEKEVPVSLNYNHIE